MKEIKRLYQAVIAVALVIAMSLLGCGGVVFADGGGEIDSDPGVPSGSGGSGSCDCSYSSTYSWIYYQSVIDYKQPIVFTPKNLNVDGNAVESKDKTISGACSAGTDRGFWHLGTDAVSSNARNQAQYNSFYSFQGAVGGDWLGFPDYKITSWWPTTTGYTVWPTNAYVSTALGASGHSDTRNVETMSHWDTANNCCGWYASRWGAGLNMEVRPNHDLYYNGKKIYQAVKYGRTSDVFKDFKTAFKYSSDNKDHRDYDPNKKADVDLWNATYAFCYWETMEEPDRTLTVRAVDMSGNSLSSSISDKTNTVKDGSFAKIERRTHSSYVFKGFSESSTGSNITAISGNTYVSGTGGIIINKKLSGGDATVYAKYNPYRTLTGYAVNTGGTKIKTDAICSSKVESGTSATCTAPSIAGWDLIEWRTSPTGSKSSTANPYIVNSLTTDTTVYAVYKKQKRTLTAIACDTGGSPVSRISGLGDVSSTVDYGDTAKVTRGTNGAFTFKGWKNASTCSSSTTVGYTTATSTSNSVYVSGNASPKESFNVKSLTSNGKVVAVYEVKSYKLTIDKDAFSSVSVVRKTSPSGYGGTNDVLSNGATIYHGDTLEIILDGSTCHPTSLGTYQIDGVGKATGTIHTVTVSNNVKVYVRSPIQKYTLTVNRAAGSKIVVNRTTLAAGADSGASTGDLYNKGDTSNETGVTKTIYCGDKITTNFGLLTGYSWGSHSFAYTDSSGKIQASTSDLEIKEHIVGSDVTVKTENVIRNKFSAQASVAEGTNWSGTTNRGLTGYYPHSNGSTTSKTINIDCVNAGCNANLWLQLKRDAGTGSTNYRIKSSTNGVSSAWLPASPSALTASSFPDSGSTLLVLGASGNVGEQIGLVPGGSFCRYIAFKPYGDYANDTYETVFACANAKVTNFEGLSKVKSSTSTGWTSTTKSVRHVIQNCSPTDGCSVTLQHALKRSNSIGSTDYNVGRTSNLWVSTKSLGVQPKDSIGSGTFNDGDANGKVVVSDTVKLYPGMVVCETLKFKPNNNQVTVAADVATTICVSAEGDGQPSDPNDPDPADPNDPNPNNPNPSDADGDSESGAYLKIEVKNNNNTKYNTYRRIVYAKPSDSLTYRAVYNPILQYTYNLVPDRMQINGSPSAPFENNSGLSLGALFNVNRGTSRRPWNNAFNVSSANFVSNVSLNYDDYANGDTSRQRETNDYKVQAAEVGRTLTETAMINQTNNSVVQTTPSQVNFRDAYFADVSKDQNLGNVMTNQIASTAYARIPYNFNTKVEVTTPEDKIVYAGEDSSVGYDIEILKKINNVTGDGTDSTSYATIVRDAKWRVINYTTTGSPRAGTSGWGDVNSDLCGYYSSVSNCGYSTVMDGQTLNNSGNMSGELTSRSSSFNVPDLDAGTRICVAVALYPSSSGSDINLSSSGSGTWRISDSKCYQIAKKPSFQLWGGGMYIAGNANIPVSAKNNLFGYPQFSYQHTGKNGYNVFGSWVETGLVAGGTVTGLASGASTGYDANNSGDLFADPGGSREESTKPLYCKRSVLSFANDHCDNSVGNIGGSTLQASMSDKSTLVKRLMPDGFNMTTNTTADRININSDYTETDSGIRYTYSANDLIINGATLASGVTHIVRSDKDITIDGNLLYQNDNYSELSRIPKLIIYGNNITISCKNGGDAIDRIDAVLIANETVDTCKTTDINSEENSHQLKINGLIIANKLKLNRTYGAAKGVYSIVPAEIINYDTTLYLWSMIDSPNASGTGKYSESYLRELSPRY